MRVESRTDGKRNRDNNNNYCYYYHGRGHRVPTDRIYIIYSLPRCWDQTSLNVFILIRMQNETNPGMEIQIQLHDKLTYFGTLSYCTYKR